jgi:hypothetical protein
VEVWLNSFSTSALEGVSGQHHAPAAFTPGKEPVPIVQEAGWAPEPVWIGAEKLAPPGFDPRTFQPVTDPLSPMKNKTLIQSLGLCK